MLTHQNQQILTPPHSKEVEMIVLGCMLTTINSLIYAAEHLQETDFYFNEHQTIFQILKSAQTENKPGDTYLVCEELKRQNKLDTVGGVSYILTLAQCVTTTSFIEEYVDIIKQKSILRQTLQLAKKIERQAMSEERAEKIFLEAQETVRKIQSHTIPKQQHAIRFLSEWKENFLLTSPPKKPMLLEFLNAKGMRQGFLPKGIVAMLVGAGGVGKTHLLAQLTISIATGYQWLNTFSPTLYCGKERKGNVFLGLGENGYDDIHRILYKAAKQIQRNSPEAFHRIAEEASQRIAPFSFCGQQSSFISNGKPTSYYTALKRRLEDLAPAEGWSLIILDPVSRLLGADAETDNASATQFIALLEELALNLPGQPTILFAHHMNKASLKDQKSDQTAARGSSALTDGVRWQLNVSKGEGNVNLLKMTKSNFTAILGEIKVKKDEEGFLELFSNSEILKETFNQPEKKYSETSISDLFLAAGNT